MKNQKKIVVISAIMITSLLNAWGAFAQEMDPQEKNPFIPSEAFMGLITKDGEALRGGMFDIGAGVQVIDGRTIDGVAVPVIDIGGLGVVSETGVGRKLGFQLASGVVQTNAKVGVDLVSGLPLYDIRVAASGQVAGVLALGVAVSAQSYSENSATFFDYGWKPTMMLRTSNDTFVVLSGMVGSSVGNYSGLEGSLKHREATLLPTDGGVSYGFSLLYSSASFLVSFGFTSRASGVEGTFVPRKETKQGVVLEPGKPHDVVESISAYLDARATLNWLKSGDSIGLSLSSDQFRDQVLGAKAIGITRLAVTYKTPL